MCKIPLLCLMFYQTSNLPPSRAQHWECTVTRYEGCIVFFVLFYTIVSLVLLDCWQSTTQISAVSHTICIICGMIKQDTSNTTILDEWTVKNACLMTMGVHFKDKQQAFGLPIRLPEEGWHDFQFVNPPPLIIHTRTHTLMHTHRHRHTGMHAHMSLNGKSKPHSMTV